MTERGIVTFSNASLNTRYPGVAPLGIWIDQLFKRRGGNNEKNKPVGQQTSRLMNNICLVFIFSNGALV